ncbi:MAG: hypothetical protein LBF40_10785 [Deltaproteobacteria bacterium]|jgi:hypothetical protein|nr:hypothetical protein [Deltaproteobacteria bacterium]
MLKNTIIGTLCTVIMALGLMSCGNSGNDSEKPSAEDNKPAPKIEGQVYSGGIPLPNSEGIVVTFVLSDDLKTAKSLRFEGKKYKLQPREYRPGAPVTIMEYGNVSWNANFSNKEIVNGKLASGSMDNFVYDLTVLDSCLYGTVKIVDTRNPGNYESQSVRVVLPNVTNPKPIPPGIG